MPLYICVCVLTIHGFLWFDSMPLNILNPSLEETPESLPVEATPIG